MSYEKAFFTRADLRIVRGSTIERKQMSTKTTIKRIALVAVAALTLGSFSAVSANAYVVSAGFRTLSWASTSATGTVGTEWSAVLKLNAACSELFTNGGQVETVTANVTAQLDQAPIGSNILSNTVTWATGTPTGYTNTNANAAIAPFSDEGTGYRKTTAITCVAASVPMVGYATVKFTPDKAGTYVVVLNAIGATTGAITQAITVTAKTVGKSTAFIGTSVGANDTATADATVSTTAASSTTAKARIDVGSIYGTTGNDTASATDAPSVVVTTTKGLVSKTNDFFAGAKTVTTAAGVDADPSYWVFSNGDVGAASITITVGGVLLATKTVTFTGVATALVATLTTGQAKYVGVDATTTLAITSTDAAASTVSNPSGLTVKSSDTSVATAVQTTNILTTITGVKAGTATITVTDPAAGATAATYTITVKAVRPTTAPTITFDKSSYNVGDVVTMTVNADMADSATASALFTTALVTSAPVTAVAGTTALSTSSAAHAIASGVATYKFYAPAVSGSFTVTGTTGGTVDITTAAAVTKTIDIVNPGVDAATAAAELAEAAAQDATDAALDATSAAELAGALAQEAVEAVAELSAQVATLIAALKKQITTLTNLVIKIQKKVGAK